MEIFFSPAKINFGLRVLGRRPDGYHLLSMVNGLLALGDEIGIEVNNSGRVEIAMHSSSGLRLDPALEVPEQNLAARAAHMIFEMLPDTLGASLSIDKRIPTGGGLGGGSSNAGCVLRVLPELLRSAGYISVATETSLHSKIIEKGVSLGADIPYFLKSKSSISLVEGIGEVVQPLPVNGIENLPIYLLFPDYPLETRAVFRHCRKSDYSQTSFYMSERSTQMLSRVWFLEQIENDLEMAARRLAPEIGELLDLGRRLNTFVFGMTGSGSTLFAIPREQEFDAISAVKILEDTFFGRNIKIIRTNLLAKPAY